MSPDFFRKALLDWSDRNPRPLPWKGIRDPYKIWLSEIILQQTRVEQGRPYYEKFIEKYPRVQDLAAAPEDEVFKIWEGLGYYSRCRNLIHTARYIAQECKGEFPKNFDGLRQLKGIGEYTAAAIASFAYGLPHAVLDGNVYRVLARCWGLDQPINSPSAKKLFSALAQDLLDPECPAAFNQAMMDFGATCCTPKSPQCLKCPFQEHCIANRQGRVQELPVKTAKPVKKERFFLFFVLEANEHIFVQKRQEKDIWHSLWQFPLLEMKRSEWINLNPESAQSLLFSHFIPIEWMPKSTKNKLSLTFRQILTHQIVSVLFFELYLPPEFDSSKTELRDYTSIPRKEILHKIAFPKVIDRYLHNKDWNLF